MDKKTGIVFLIFLSFLMSIALGLIVPATNTGSVTLEGFVFIFGLSFVLTFLVGVLLPIPRMTAWFCGNFGMSAHHGGGKLLSILFSNTLVMLLLTFIMVGVITGFGEVGETNYLGRYVTGLLHIQPIIVVTCLFADPLAMFLTRKILRLPAPNAEAAAAENEASVSTVPKAELT